MIRTQICDMLVNADLNNLNRYADTICSELEHEYDRGRKDVILDIKEVLDSFGCTEYYETGSVKFNLETAIYSLLYRKDKNE